MSALSPCVEQFSIDRKSRRYYVTLRITCNGKFVSEQELSIPLAILKVLYLLLKILASAIYDKIKDLLFPYSATEEDVEEFFKKGNSFLDRMSNKEKSNYLKKDTTLPLGL
ncbi:MAG: hypothetical protein D3903_09290 [Candidatus Electrothrix sp. GM3_4]|nr:hypothetical protein [Candidatus Electrothrix sp. GM3_4]